MIRVLIVDDSSTMRKLIAASLADDVEFQVVGEAADPLEARYDRTREHLHDRPARFARRLRLNGDVSTRATNRVMDAKRIGPGSLREQEQRRHWEERFSHRLKEQRAPCYCVSRRQP